MVHRIDSIGQKKFNYVDQEPAPVIVTPVMKLRNKNRESIKWFLAACMSGNARGIPMDVIEKMIDLNCKQSSLSDFELGKGLCESGIQLKSCKEHIRLNRLIAVAEYKRFYKQEERRRRKEIDSLVEIR